MNKLPINLEFKYVREISTIDNTTFPECHSKQILVWRWSKLKHIVYLVHHNGDIFDIQKLE
jgi:hypothetical protein